MFRERILIFLKESETSPRHFICSWVQTNNLISEKKGSYEDYKAFSKEFSTLDYRRGVDFRHRVFVGTGRQTDYSSTASLQQSRLFGAAKPLD